MSSIVIQITGRPPIHDQPTTISGEQNAFSGLVTGEAQIFGRLSTEGPNTYYEETVSVVVPAREDEVTATFPASPFTADVYRIGLSVEVPPENRGGIPMVEVWAPNVVTNAPQAKSGNGRTRVSSFRGGEVMFFDSNDKAWAPLAAAFLSRQPIELYVSGFESFGTWTEPRAYALPVVLRLRSWGEN